MANQLNVIDDRDMLVDRIAAARRELNDAIMDATKLGIKVEVEVWNTQQLGSRYPMPQIRADALLPLKPTDLEP